MRQLGVFCSLSPLSGGLWGGSSSVMHPLPGALPTRSCGFFCQATSTGGGAHHLALLGRAVPPILLALEGKGKGSHAYDSMAIRRLRPFLMPGFSVPQGFSMLRGFSVFRVGYLVFGFLAGGFIIAALLITSGVLRDGVERLRGVVCPRCGRRFGGASGDGLGGCIS